MVVFILEFGGDVYSTRMLHICRYIDLIQRFSPFPILVQYTLFEYLLFMIFFWQWDHKECYDCLHLHKFKVQQICKVYLGTAYGVPKNIIIWPCRYYLKFMLLYCQISVVYNPTSPFLSIPLCPCRLWNISRNIDQGTC